MNASSLHSTPHHDAPSRVGGRRRAVDRGTIRGAAALAVTAVLALTSGAVRADGFSCGNRIVTEGMELYQVRDVCGEPAQVTRTAILRRPVVWVRGRPYYASNEEVQVPVETWLYDFGPQRLMRKLRFEDGILARVDTLGYGTNR